MTVQRLLSGSTSLASSIFYSPIPMKLRPFSLVTAVAFAGLAFFSACSKSFAPAEGGKAGGADGKITVGFAQTGAESAWRTANTDSMKSEAAKRGIEL